MSITIYGASDDLIEIEGDIREEFNFYPDAGESRYLAISDGTVLRVEYDDDGIWRIVPITVGKATFSKKDGLVSDDTNDVVTLSGVIIDWVVMGDEIAKR